MLTLFWIATVFVLYVYLIYPAFVIGLAKLKAPAATQSRSDIPEGDLPSLTIVVAAHNEASGIVARIQNLQQLNYGDTPVHILVVSDGSTDDTAKLVQALPDTNIQVLEVVEQSGKSNAINSAMAQVTTELVAFTDVRQTFDQDALLYLVGRLAEPGVDAVSGNLIIQDAAGSDLSGLYWRYEKMIRQAESDLSSMIGATGAIYAIKRDRFNPIPVDVLVDDLYVPMSIVLAGGKTKFEPKAIAYDVQSKSPMEEYHRKKRTLFGNWQLAHKVPALNKTSTNPLAVQWLSHKLGRLLVPFFLIVAAFCGALSSNSFAQLAAFAIIASAVYAAIAHYYPSLRRFMPLQGVCVSFYTLNLAALTATISYYGNGGVQWIKH